jgi:hypothetical protein
VGDCNNFLTSNENWAERAAKLGWDAPAILEPNLHRAAPVGSRAKPVLVQAIP